MTAAAVIFHCPPRRVRAPAQCWNSPTNLVQGPRGHHKAAQYLADGPTYYVFGRNGTAAHRASGVTWRDSIVLAANSENPCQLQTNNSKYI